MWAVAKKILRSREASTFIVLAVLAVGISLATDVFFSVYNLRNLSRQIGLLTIMGLGETIVIITGGIDLSMGSLVAFIGVLASCILSPAPPQQFIRFQQILSALVMPCVGIWICTAIPYALIRHKWLRRLFFCSTTIAVAVVFLYGIVSIAPGEQGGTANSFLVIFGMLSFCALIGVYHGLLVTYLNLPPFVVTLGSMCILRGCALLLTQSLPVMIEDSFFEYIGNGNLFTMPVPFVLSVILTLGMAVTLTTTSFGRRIFAVGGNETATYYSGIHVKRVKIGAYVLCAVLGGIAALLYAGYDRQGNPSSGAFYELNAIAAAVVGGASLMGGEGSMIGTFFGSGILQVILNGINLIIRQGSSLWEGVIVGLVVVAAVTFNTLRARRG
ncbi:MAG TPA: ABC transporter permease [bacterium]|nr:ABC transporter permease [bacterium]